MYKRQGNAERAGQRDGRDLQQQRPAHAEHLEGRAEGDERADREVGVAGHGTGELPAAAVADQPHAVPEEWRGSGPVVVVGGFCTSTLAMDPLCSYLRDLGYTVTTCTTAIGTVLQPSPGPGHTYSLSLIHI